MERLSNLFGIFLDDLMNEGASVEPSQITFHLDVIQDEDFSAITEIRKIALYLNQMRMLLLENTPDA